MVNQRDISVKISLPTVIGAVGLETLMRRGWNTACGCMQHDSPVGKLWTVVSVGLAVETDL